MSEIKREMRIHLEARGRSLFGSEGTMWCGLDRKYAARVTTNPAKATCKSCVRRQKMYTRDADERDGVEPETPRA